MCLGVKYVSSPFDTVLPMERICVIDIHKSGMGGDAPRVCPLLQKIRHVTYGR